MAKLVPLADELRASIILLRKRNHFRAANRLERLSQHILKPNSKTSRTKTRKVKLINASGRATIINISQDLLDQMTAEDIQ